MDKWESLYYDNGAGGEGKAGKPKVQKAGKPKVQKAGKPKSHRPGHPNSHRRVARDIF